MRNHKTIACGRPKACEFVKAQFSRQKIKTIEVCGFSHENVKQYVINFFDEDLEKANKVQGVITSSYNLKIMSTVPVFLWVICNVYSEDLIKSPINTNTELYFYTCLVFLRNHFQGCSNSYTNLLDIVNDQEIMDVIFSLMVLSVKTYMKNQVLFTDEDIKKLKCPMHLERTGFIVKYSRSNTAQSIFQFRHLILQEFFCGMFLCVTKRVSSFSSNRELTSCLPTILGIHRIIQEKDNEIFLQFYEALLTSNSKVSNCFGSASTRLKGISYNKFIKSNILKLPRSMVKGGTLSISDDPECREFLDLFKETNNKVDARSFDNTTIKLNFYQDYKNVLNLLEELNVTTIHSCSITSQNFFDENGDVNENILGIYEMTAGPSMTAALVLGDCVNRGELDCTSQKISLKLRDVALYDIWKLLEIFQIINIHGFEIHSHDIFGESGNIDENISRLTEMTAGSSMIAYVYIGCNSGGEWIKCSNEKLAISTETPLQLCGKNILDLLEKINAQEVTDFSIKSNDIFDENGNINENVLRLYGMTELSSSSIADIFIGKDETDGQIECGDEKLILSLAAPHLTNISKGLEQLKIKVVNQFEISSGNILGTSGTIDENVLKLYKMTVGEDSISTEIEISSNRQIDYMSCTDEALVLSLHAPLEGNIKNILKVLGELQILKIQKFKITLENLANENTVIDEALLRLYDKAVGSVVETEIEVLTSDTHQYDIELENGRLRFSFGKPAHSGGNYIIDLLDKLGIMKIHKLEIASEKNIFKNGIMDEYIATLYQMTARSSMRIEVFQHYSIGNDKLFCAGGGLILDLYPPVSAVLPDILKTTSNSFHLQIYEGALSHPTVRVFVQETTRYAVEQRKPIRFHTYFRYPSIRTLLKQADVDANSKYIHGLNK